MPNSIQKRSPLLTPFISGLLLLLTLLNADATQNESAIYDPDPKHLWNRLNETLFIRTASDGKKYGFHELDILYWRTTKNLLVEPSHQQALAILDEFINTHGEKLIRDPLKRALLQRDLWHLFDWTALDYRTEDAALACRALQPRLVTIIRRLALRTNEIAALPDNYLKAEEKGFPDLPRGLSETNADWVGLNAGWNESVAPTHAAAFDGRSAFSVMLNVPGGREATLSYLEKLRSFAKSERPLVYQTNRFLWANTNSPREILELNPKIPQFPTNTQWALIRWMCVIDNEGRIQPTSITESIQLRRYRKIQTAVGDPDLPQSTNVVQEFFEFQMDRHQHAALRPIGRDEKDFNFVHFMGNGIDQLEDRPRKTDEIQDSQKLQTVVLKTCFACHSSPGIFSVNSYTHFMNHDRSPVDFLILESNHEFTQTKHWKQRQFNWGLLQGLWRYEK